MPQIINTNIASINAQRNLDKSQGENQTALQRLSSGLRINSAKDDAAGLAISTRFSAQIQGLEVAVRNAGDGVSLAQTAEGALGSMTDNLLRIRDLALQAANATNSSIDREALNTEVQQLIEEIERVSLQTAFNGTKLLDGTFKDVTFQIGANEGENVSFGIGGTKIDQLGTSQTDGISSEPEAIALSAGDLVINGIAVGASSGVNDSFSSGDQDVSAIAKAAAINAVSDQTGVTAVVNGTFLGGTTSFLATTQNTTVTVNSVNVNISVSSNLSDSVNLQNVAAAINEVSGQSGVTATFSGNPTQGVQLTATDGRNIIVQSTSINANEFGLAASDTTAAAGVTYSGTYTLISSGGSTLALDTTTGNIGNAGLAVGQFSGNNSGAISDEVPGTNLLAGDIVINGVPVGPSLDNFDTASNTQRSESAIAKAVAINEVTDRTGVTAQVNSAILTGGTILTSSSASGSIDINGVQINISYGSNDSVADRQNALTTAINNKAGQSGVRSEPFGSTFRLISDDGRNISVDSYTGVTGTQIGLDSTAVVTAVVQGTITLLSSGKISLDTITGNINNSGFEVGGYGSGEDGTLVQDMNISTVEGALLALSAVDNALNTINLQRANLGAIQNRFESTIETQQITSENLSASNSRIQDANFAAETAELSRTQVLQQAGLSVLAQANAQPESVLQLLQ